MQAPTPYEGYVTPPTTRYSIDSASLLLHPKRRRGYESNMFSKMRLLERLGVTVSVAFKAFGVCFIYSRN